MSLVEPPGVRVSFLFDLETNGTVDEYAKLQYELARARAVVPAEIKARMGSITQDTDLRIPVLQISDLLAWSLRRKVERHPSPVLDLVRDEKRLRAVIECDPRASGIAQLTIELDQRARDLGNVG